ncbi:probable tRNA (uracil-O(2)-)-methyltransferase [Aricia agestis]|uniref:probable tRNA (uracil-O(2)-)-methyltransferase n=1 Tax=Aricia agestis TaxID=91739 RepID=UPI001C204EE8|nr:probable tRNA (uracil-O(2)-)-methyltransferase [Aricia agestis]
MELINNITSFWAAITILITKPHVVNKRLWGQKVLKKFVFKVSDSDYINCIKHYIAKVKLTNTDNLEEFCKSLHDDIVHNLNLVESDDGEVEILLVELLPKCYSEHHAYQLVCLLKHKGQVIFYDVSPEDRGQTLCPNFSYTFYSNGKSLDVKSDCDPDDKRWLWLKKTVVPQVTKWAHEDARGHTSSMCKESLMLVSHDEYYELYNELKLKHGKELVKIWPECTDPLKFVYEDIAIATYLLLYWKLISKSPLNFVDLGCGNGLLVYVLTMEGHKGIGIDVRKRKIWDMYPENIKLQEHTVTPNRDVFTEADWIIGNHSDELTPWIPVIAAKSSYKCNFFLLPCCAYNFDGTKYQRQNSSISQYTEYLDKIYKLCVEMGFETSKDRLKIPSTKRICFISSSRTYTIDKHERQIEIVNNMVACETGVHNNNEQIIKTRDPIEKVKNCTQIDKNVIDYIVECISNYLLKDIDLKSKWEIGKTVRIDELIEILPENYLNSLKSECGGLQTLLRNNHQIFEVQKGHVKIRYPKTIDEVKINMSKSKKRSKIKMQVKKCWFYNNHPQGCPLESFNCSFLHEKS